MKKESDSIKRYHTKEGFLFLSSFALLFLSPYIKIGKTVAVHIRDFLELPIEITDELPALALLYLTTLALAFYVFVEWRRLDDSERKSIQNWSFAAFEAFAVFALYWRYADLMRNTPYGQFSPLWFVPFVVLGFLFGTAISMFRFAFSLRRTRDEAKCKHLPRMPRQAKEMIIENSQFSLLVLVPGTVAAFYFYPGPTWWVPCVLLLVSIVPGLPTYGFLSEEHSDEIPPLDQLKAVTDWSDHMEHLAKLMKRAPYKEFHEDVARQHLSPQETQKLASEKVKEIEQRRISKVSTGFLGVIPGSNPKTLVFERVGSNGAKRQFKVKEEVASKWFIEYIRLLEASNKEFAPKDLDGFAFKWANYIVDEILFRERGLSLLMDRLQRKIEEDLELIISVDPNLNQQYVGGYTPLLQATADGFVPAVKLLIKYGADLEIKNNLGVTPFLFAARYDNVELLRLLKESGANIHATDATGDDALMKAAQWNCKAVAPLLIQWGLDVRRKNHLGKNALEMATASKAGEIATTIRRKMIGGATSGSKKGKKRRRK